MNDSPVPRRRHLLALALAAVLPARAQLVVEGYPYAREAKVGGQTLSLNGVGLRAVAWLKAYAAGLYLVNRATTTEAVLADPGPKRVQMRMLLDVTSDEFVKAFDKSVARNTPPAEQPALRERRERFNAMVLALGKVKKGDLIDLDWVPGSGLVFAYNGRVQGPPVPGADLYAALLRVFIGVKPLDPEMKIGMLGGPVG